MKHLLLALPFFILLGCGSGSSPATGSGPAPQPTPVVKVEPPLPAGCARDCTEGKANCLNFFEKAMAAYPGEFDRISAIAARAAVGVENEMTLGKNGKLRIEFKDNPWSAASFTLKPTKKIVYRRVESSILRLELVPKRTAPKWLMDDEGLATEWYGTLRSIEVLPNLLALDFSGNCLGFSRDNAH